MSMEYGFSIFSAFIWLVFSVMKLFDFSMKYVQWDIN